MRGIGQDTGGQPQQQQPWAQPWAQRQSPGWQGLAPGQPVSWGPQVGQGPVFPVYGTGLPPPPPPPYPGVYHESLLRSQTELNQQLVAAITRSGPPATVPGLDDSQNSMAAEAGTKELQSVLKYKTRASPRPSRTVIQRMWKGSGGTGGGS